MAYYSPSRPAPFGALTVYAVVRAAERVLNAIRSRLNRTTTKAVLAKMSDRELADIGIVRATENLDVIKYSPFSARF